MTPHTKIAFGVASVVAALSWFVPGCGQTTSEDPLGPDGGPSTQTFPDASACVPLASCAASACPSSPDGGFPCYWSCGQVSMCGTVEFSSAGNGCSSSGCTGDWDAALAYTVDETAARCVLTAMMNDTPGEVAWGTSVSSAQGLSTYHEDVNIITERQTYGWWQYESDSYSYGRYAGKQLQPASYLKTCLASNDVSTYLTCLQNAYAACP
jgi:hypothetical protein